MSTAPQLQPPASARPEAASFSTIYIGGVFSNVANKFLLEGVFSIERTWRKITAVRNVSDFKTASSYRLTLDRLHGPPAPFALRIGSHGEPTACQGLIGEDQYGQFVPAAKQWAVARQREGAPRVRGLVFEPGCEQEDDARACKQAHPRVHNLYPAAPEAGRNFRGRRPSGVRRRRPCRRRRRRPDR